MKTRVLLEPAGRDDRASLSAQLPQQPGCLRKQDEDREVVVATASAEATAQASSQLMVGARRARRKNQNEAATSRVNSEYARASCEYQMSIGLIATSAAAARPGVRPLTGSGALAEP